jgi:DNA repair exonuclease SbcCD ATPase subunit
MAAAPKPGGELARAADDFEQELSRYERLCSELARTRIQSEKSLTRKRRLLEEFSEREAELGARLKGLLGAIHNARERQQRCIETAVAAANELQERAAQFSELMASVAALGERARIVSQPASELTAGADDKATAGVIAPLDHVNEQLDSVARDADAIARSADEQDWPEVARDVRSLRQQLSAMHAKLSRLRADVAKRTLS